MVAPRERSMGQSFFYAHFPQSLGNIIVLYLRDPKANQSRISFKVLMAEGSWEVISNP